MAGCHVLLSGYGGSVVSTLGSCAGGGDGSWGTFVLNMDSSCLRTVVCLSPRCSMGLDVIRFCRASVRSSAVLVTKSAGDSLGEFFWTGNSPVVSDTHSNAVLGI